MGDPIVLAGRQADPARPDETEINEEMAEALGVWVGDTITVTPLTTAQLGELEAGVELDAAGTPAEVRVVGVTRAPIDVLARGDSSRATTTRPFDSRRRGTASTARTWPPTA